MSGDYTLTSDIVGHSGTCFNIKANNVVLDCDDYTISSDDTGSGILLNGITGTVVKNCNIRNFEDGIKFEASSKNILENITSDNNKRRGVYLRQRSNDNNITNVSVVLNGHNGIQIQDSIRNIITDTNSTSNSGNGIVLYDSASSNSLTRILAGSNAWHGIQISLNSNYNKVNDSQLIANNYYGVIVQDNSVGYDISGNTYINNQKGDNKLGVSVCGKLKEDAVLVTDITDVSSWVCFQIYEGVELDCRGMTIDGDNLGSGDGILVEEDGATIRNCKIKEFNSGISLRSDNNLIENIQSDSNLRYGIILNPSSGNTLTNITTNGNGFQSGDKKDGILIYTGSSDNILTNIESTSNARHGINIASDSLRNSLEYVNSSYNTRSGVMMAIGSTDTQITDSEFNSNTKYGVRIDSTSAASWIVNNDFISNGIANVLDEAGATIWDDGFSGNYWQDYIDAGNSDDGSNGRITLDGVGDTNLPHFGDNNPMMRTKDTPKRILIDVNMQVNTGEEILSDPIGTEPDAEESNTFESGDLLLTYGFNQGTPDQIWYTIDGGITNITTVMTEVPELTFAEGTHTVTVYVNNSLGEEANDSQTFTVDFPDPITPGPSGGIDLRGLDMIVPELEGTQGSQLIFDVQVENTRSSTMNLVKLKLTQIPEGWEYIVAPETQSISGKQTGTYTVTLTIPADAELENEVRFEASSGTSLKKVIKEVTVTEPVPEQIDNQDQPDDQNQNTGDSNLNTGAADGLVDSVTGLFVGNPEFTAVAGLVSLIILIGVYKTFAGTKLLK
jgi:nitrous oxidase accessory protein NosD